MSERKVFEGGGSNGGKATAAAPQLDDPPNSRLFIVGSKKLTENEFREAFSKFGEIEDIWMVRDRRTGEPKGVTYIKYSKTSEAATAYEAMNGKTMHGSDRQIKVMIASSRNKGSQREENEDEKIQRLFIVAPKTMTEVDLEQQFKAYGDIDYVNIVRDKETRESKGFAYIKYYKFSHAAKAFEECDRKYKAVFSEPRKPSMKRYSATEFSDRTVNNCTNDGFNSDKCYRLMVIGSPYLTEDQLWKLCNIVPGLEYAHLRIEAAKRRAIGTVVYSSKQWATYAAEKLHGFEYPTGSRLIVKPDGTVPRIDSPRSVSNSRLSGADTPTNLIQLAETIAHATSIIQNAGLAVGASKSNSFDIPTTDSLDICSIRLPSPQPLASIDAETQARCFIVCTPPPPSSAILRDIFCRFGNLIEVYLLANKNCGYAKYATKESAAEAIKVLHGADVCGGRIKVIKAEERNEQSRKRQRTDE